MSKRKKERAARATAHAAGYAEVEAARKAVSK